MKLRQALARATNELLCSITVPLRRLKADSEAKFLETLDKMPSDTERDNARKERFELQKQQRDLTVWLKDFPRNAQDF